MEIRKEDNIEIWTDVPEKGTGKKYIIYGFVSIVIFILLVVLMRVDFTIIETYIFLFAILFIPSYLFFIAGIIFIVRERMPAKLIAKVNKDFLYIYTKKETKQIKIDQITKINKILSRQGDLWVIKYNENGKECKESLMLDRGYQRLIETAIQEYNSNVQIELRRRNVKNQKFSLTSC